MARMSRLDDSVRRDWLALCAEHAPVAVDGRARLVHGDINPKHMKASRNAVGTRSPTTQRP